MKILEKLRKPASIVAIFSLVTQFLFLGTPTLASVPVTTIVGWNFPSTSADAVADSGIAANLTKTLTASGVSDLHFDGGSPSTDRYAWADHWDNNDYWEINFSTVGYGSLQLTSKQYSSPHGPRYFDVQYKVGVSGTWNEIADVDLSPGSSWKTLPGTTIPTAANNQSSVYVRWILPNSVSAGGGGLEDGGTSRIDDIMVTGLASDTTPPTGTFTYAPSSLTNGNVISTLVPSEPVTVTNNSGSIYHTFYDNGSFTYTFVDGAGNAGSATATVTWIDKINPVSAAVIDNSYYGPNSYPAGTIKGTASDASGITQVQLTIKRSSDNHYWDGSGWTHSTVQYVTASGTTSWTYALAAANLTNSNVYTVTPYATDGANNTAAGTADSFTWDSVAPVTSAMPLSLYYDTGAINVNYSAADALSGVASVKLFYRKDGGSWTQYTSGSFTSSPIVFDSALTGGSGHYDFYTVGTDNVANVEVKSPVAERSTMIDTIYPFVGLPSVTTDFSPYVDGLGFNAQAYVSDVPSGIDGDSCYYSIDNGSTWHNADYNSVTSTCYKNGLTATDGTVLHIIFQVSDIAGNYTNGDTLTRTADSLLPTVSNLAVSPDFSSTYTSASPAVTATVGDSVSGVTACGYRYISFGGVWSDWNEGLLSGSTCVANFSGLRDNLYTFEFRALDGVNHFSDFGDSVTTDKISRIVDGSGPTNPGEPTTTPNPTNQTTQNWSWDPSTDNGSDLAGYWFKIGLSGTPQFTVTPNISTSLSDGTYDVYVEAVDNVGNASSWVHGSVVVDTVAPTVTVTAPADGLLTNNPDQTFTATASEDAVACTLDFSGSNFESGLAGWVTSGHVAITSDTYHSPSHSLQLQTTNDWPASINTAYTTVTLPSSGPINLSAWIKQSTADSFYWDQQRIYLANTSGTALVYLLNTDQNYDWHNVSYDISAYAGQTVRIYFYVHDDGAGDPTRMWVDDVTVNGMSGGTHINMTQGTDGVWSANVNPVEEGISTYTVSCTDAAGNVGHSEERTIEVDSDTPTATVSYSTTAPTNGNVTATLHPGEPVTITNNGGSDSYVFTENGSFTFEFVDPAGNTGSATATVSNIDKVAPSVPTLLTPANGSFTSNPDVYLGWTDSDDNVGPVTYEVSWSQDPTFTTDVSVDTPSVSHQTTDSLSEGTWYWRVRAFDPAGNYSGYSETWSFTVDQTEPVITVDPVTVTIEKGSVPTYDVLNGVSVSDNLDTSLTVSDIVVSGDTVDTTKVGVYHIYYDLSDSAGNEADQKSRTVNVVDTTPPKGTVTYTTNPDGTITATLTTDEPVTITNNGGSSTYNFSANGSFIFQFVDPSGNTGSAVATATFPIAVATTGGPATVATGAAPAVAGAQTTAPAASNTTTPENKEVKGAQKNNTAKDCQWWWIILLILAASVSAVSYRNYRKDVEPKYWWLWPVVFGLLAVPIHLYLHDGSKNLWFCNWFWALDAALVIVILIAYNLLRNRKGNQKTSSQ